MRSQGGRGDGHAGAAARCTAGPRAQRMPAPHARGPGMRRQRVRAADNTYRASHRALWGRAYPATIASPASQSDRRSASSSTLAKLLRLKRRAPDCPPRSFRRRRVARRSGCNRPAASATLARRDVGAHERTRERTPERLPVVHHALCRPGRCTPLLLECSGLPHRNHRRRIPLRLLV